MQTVTIAENPFEPSSWGQYECEDIRALLIEHFDAWPSGGRIYQGQVSQDRDVTPVDEAGIERLGKLPGPFWVIVYPEDPITILSVVAVVMVASWVFSLLRPSIPGVRKVPSGSPNNSLGTRQNVQRLGERIPDIYGEVISIPDLIAAPYKIFDSKSREVEYSLLCVGRGEYDISEAKDGATLIDDIEGTCAAVYSPGYSPANLPAQETWGDGTLETRIITAKRFDSVNGQILKPLNVTFKGYDSDPDRCIGGQYRWPYYVDIEPDHSGDFTEYFSIGDSVIIEDHTDGSWDGTYLVDDVHERYLTLHDPWTVNAKWYDIEEIPMETWNSIDYHCTKDRWTDSYTVDLVGSQEVWLNFSAPSGLYRDDGTRQYSLYVSLKIGITPVDESGTPTGPEEYFYKNLYGSQLSRDQVAVTSKSAPSVHSRFKVRVLNMSLHDYNFAGQTMDEVHWLDLYGIRINDKLVFGDVTIAQVATIATKGAMSAKERRFNLRVTRRVPIRITGETFSPPAATKRAADILTAICVDPHIGRRAVAELDLDNIYNTVSAVESYFGHAMAGYFSHTFDDDGTSLEEMVAIVSAAIHCEAYRRGSEIKLSFEKETDDSTVLFCHRNKLPGTETRTVSFGNKDENDGVEVTYVKPDDGLIDTLYLPADQSAVNPKKVETTGIHQRLQAYFHAQRTWNKIQYQNTSLEFEATQEANIIVPSERILVTDGTRPGIQDGEIISQNGLILELSQSVTFVEGVDYTIFLQHIDGTVEALACVLGVDSRHVVLGEAPKAALALADNLYARTTYSIAGSTDPRSQAFLMTEKDPQSNFTVTVRAINYDSRYYQADKDYADEVVDEDGYPL